MLVAKKDTHEKMQDGTYRKVKAGEAFLNPETNLIKNIEKWAIEIAEEVVDEIKEELTESDTEEVVDDDSNQESPKKRGRPKKTEAAV